MREKPLQNEAVGGETREVRMTTLHCYMFTWKTLRPCVPGIGQGTGRGGEGNNKQYTHGNGNDNRAIS